MIFASAIVVFSTLILTTFGQAAAHHYRQCDVTRCAPNGPKINFPFRLESQDRSCGYPCFLLSCDQNDDTVMDFSFLIKTTTGLQQHNHSSVKIDNIDYKSQLIYLSFGTDVLCLPRLNLPTLNPPFYLQPGENITVFSCPSSKYKADYGHASCPSKPGYRVHVARSYYSDFEYPLFSCTKMYNTSLFSFLHPHDGGNIRFRLVMKWSQPDCTECYAGDKNCGSNTTNSTNSKTECFLSIGSSRQGQLIAGAILGFFAVALAITAVSQIIRTNREERNGQAKIERFLQDYRNHKPTRYSHEDIKKITNTFEHKLGSGGFGSVYKGQLSSSVLVAVKVLQDCKGNGEDFINEVGTIGRIHHINVVRLVGYCADGFRRALVYDFMTNCSLDKYLSPRINSHYSFSWEKLQDVAMGIAKGIEYLHQGCHQRILHCDIKPHNILLDHSFVPKVSDFGLAKLCSKDVSAVSMTAARGTIGCIAPEMFSRNFGSVSHK